VYDRFKHRGQQEVLTKTLTELFLAALVFTGGHFLLSARPVRERLVARFGEPHFLAAYSALMLAVFAWLILSYAPGPYVALWATPDWARPLALVVMPFAFVLLTGAFRCDNPTAVGALARGRNEPPGFFGVTRHPFLWATTLWALVHIPANGDAASLILFGAILLLALPGTIALDAKLARRYPEGFVQLARTTSNVPFAHRRSRLVPSARLRLSGGDRSGSVFRAALPARVAVRRLAAGALISIILNRQDAENSER
jgi:uncharacterized membrane protein